MAAEGAHLAAPAHSHGSVKDRIGTDFARKELCNYGSWQSAVGGLVSEGSCASVVMVEYKTEGCDTDGVQGCLSLANAASINLDTSWQLCAVTLLF